MSTTTYAVQGMTCGGCAAKVSSAVDRISGITDASADPGTGTLTVTGPRIDDAAVRAAVTDAGYTIT